MNDKTKTHTEDHSFRFVVDDKQEQQTSQTYQICQSFQSFQTNETLLPQLLSSSARQPEIHEDVQSSIGERRIAGCWLLVLGCVLLAALAEAFIVLQNLPATMPALAKGGLPATLSIVLCLLVLSVGGLAAMLVGWNKLATASVWAKRVSWMFVRVPTQKMLLREKGKVLQLFADDYSMDPVAEIASKKVHWFSPAGPADNRKPFVADELVNARFDLFPGGGAVIETSQARIWGVVSDSKFLRVKSRLARTPGSRYSLTEIANLEQRKWLVALAILMAGCVELFVSLNALLVPSSQVRFSGYLLAAVLVLHIPLLLRRFLGSFSRLSGYENSLMMLAMFSFISGDQPEVDAYNASLAKVGQVPTEEKAAFVRSVATAVNASNKRCRLTLLRNRLVMTAIVIALAFGSLDFVLSKQPQLIHDYSMYEVEHYAPKDGHRTERFRLGTANQVLHDVYSNVGKETKGLQVVVSGSAVSAGNVGNVRAIFYNTTGYQPRTNMQTVALHHESDGTWRGQLDSFPVPHATKEVFLIGESSFEIEIWVDAVKIGRGTVLAKVNAMEKPFAVLPINFTKYEMKRDIEVIPASKPRHSTSHPKYAIGRIIHAK